MLPSMTDLQFLALQIDTLFLVDREGRLQSLNEPGAPPAPRFFLGRTARGCLWRARADLPADLLRRLTPLCRAALTRQPAQDEAIRAVLAAHAPVTDEYRGPAYWLPHVAHVPPGVLLLSAEHAQLVRATFPWLVAWLADPANGPVAAVVEQGQAVSVCFCSRLTRQAAEAGVQTLEPYRGSGYATAAVAGWAAAMQQSQRMALYSTSWENQASQAVAKKLGAVRYGEDWSIT